MTLITSEMTEILFLLSSWNLQSSSGLFHDLLFLGHLRFKKNSAKVMLDSFYLEYQNGIQSSSSNALTTPRGESRAA